MPDNRSKSTPKGETAKSKEHYQAHTSMKRIFFEIEGTPKAQPRHRHTGRRTYDPAKKAKAEFLLQSNRYRPTEPIKGVVFMYMVFYFPVPKSTTKAHLDILKEVDYLRPILPSAVVNRIGEAWKTDADLLAAKYPKINPYPGLWDWFYTKKKNDADNLQKFVMDAFNKEFYEDDGQVQIMGAMRLYSARPRTSIEMIYEHRPEYGGTIKEGVK